MTISPRFHVKLVVLLLLSIPLFSCAQKISVTTLQLRPMPALPPKEASLESYVDGFAELKGLPVAYRDWFYWTNYSRQRPKAFWDSVIQPILSTHPNMNTSYAASLKKELYQLQPLPLIKPNASLMKIAKSHAADLGNNSPGKISHSSTNGDAFEKRVFAAGIQKCAAENLSLGPGDPVLSLVLLYIDEGLSHLGHRKNLMSPYYVEMGIGIAKSKGDFLVTVQDFACSQKE